MRIPVLAFVGRSGCGKTTLLTKLVPLLREKGLRVGIIKHTRHSPLETDMPGTDTRRYWDAGADSVMLVGGDRTMVTHRLIYEPPLDGMLRDFASQGHLDLVVLEGYKQSEYPKIEVIRQAHSPKPLTGLFNRVAFVTDMALSELPTDTLPCFDLQEYAEIADFVVNFVKQHTFTG